MIDVVVVGEGRTEATFVSTVLAPIFGERNISLKSHLIKTGEGGRGGALSPARVIKALRNTLRERADTFVTTFFDLYGLRPGFPGAASDATDPLARCVAIERSLADAVIRESGCRVDRFIPHIQPYEFEALLFADVSKFGETRPDWVRFQPDLQRVRDAALTPEHIDGGATTHPSARLQRILKPHYQKPVYGSAVAQRIGLDRIRSECRHFNGWLTRLENLEPLA